MPLTPSTTTVSIRSYFFDFFHCQNDLPYATTSRNHAPSAYTLVDCCVESWNVAVGVVAMGFGGAVNVEEEVHKK